MCGAIYLWLRSIDRCGQGFAWQCRCFQQNERKRANLFELLWNKLARFKGVVNCQNTGTMWFPECNSAPPPDIPQWHITPHPQLSAKIIILYAFHTHRRIKSKFPSHMNSIYLSDIYEEIIHHFPLCGLCVVTQKPVLPWGSGNSWPPAYWQ